MKAKDLAFTVVVIVLIALTPNSPISVLARDVLADARPAPLAAPVGTAFTYQGQLTDGGVPADGVYDFQFTLWDAETSGGQIGSLVTRGDIVVAGGFFTVELDFGASAFAGEARWLEIGVRPGGSSGSYTTLDPRQEITPAPYALDADMLDGQHGSSFMAAGTDNWVNISGDTMTGPLTLDRYAPIVTFRENDQTLPNGLWRVAVDGTAWRVDENMAVAGDFSTYGPRFFLQSGGNVGIGTSSPQAKLDIAGETRIGSSAPTIHMVDTTPGQKDYWLRADNGNMYVLYDEDDDGDWDAPNPLVFQGVSATFGGAVETGNLTVNGPLEVDASHSSIHANLGVVGNLDVNGRIRLLDGYADGFFPRPDYDSGWVAIGMGEVSAGYAHGLGGDTSDYVIDFLCKSGTTISNGGLGQDLFGYSPPSYQQGAWYRLTSSGIDFVRGDHDTWCPLVRARIWVIN